MKKENQLKKKKKSRNGRKLRFADAESLFPPSSPPCNHCAARCWPYHCKPTRARRRRGRDEGKNGNGEICCHSNRPGARLTSKPRQRERDGAERKSSHGGCPSRWEGWSISSVLTLYRPTIQLGIRSFVVQLLVGQVCPTIQMFIKNQQKLCCTKKHSPSLEEKINFIA